MSNVPMLNECGACKMKFENAAQLANHVKKFCSNSDYNNLDKLNKKYNELRQGNGSLNQNLDQKDQQALNIGPLTISQAKGLMKTQDPQFKELERVAQKKREEELEEQLLKYKQDRQAFRAQQREDEEALSSLYNKYESKKDLELQQKVEKEYIQNSLNDPKLNILQRQNLEQLQKQRENLLMKETQFVDNVSQMRGSTPNMMGQRNYQDLAIQEKSEKLKQLRQQQEDLERERLKIMSNVDKTKANDFNNLPKSQLSKAGASLVGFNNNPQQNQFQQDIYNRPLSKHNNYDNNQQFNNMNGVQQQYNPYQLRTQSRDQIIEQERQKDWKAHSQKMLDDLAKARTDYSKAGGKDPVILQNFDNLEKFYLNPRLKSANKINNSFDIQSISPATNNIPNANKASLPDMQMQNQMAQMVNQLQQQVLALQKESQYSRVLLQQEQEQMRLRQELETLQKGSQPILNPQGMPNEPSVHPFNNPVMFGKNGDPIVLNNQNNFTLSQINSKLHGFSEHGENPFSIFTPQQEFLLQNEVRTVDLDEEERILANLQKEEVDQLRILSRIPVGTELYRFKMEQYKELSTVKAEMEKIANEQKLQRLRMEFEYQRREEDRQFDNEKWNDDQRKWILAQRIRKDLGPIGGIKQYDQNDGLVIHWDYILGLPKRTNFSQVVFGIFNRSDTLYAPKIVDPKECEVESSETVRCIIGDSHQIFDIPPNPDALLIMEIQIPYSKKQGENVNKTESYGWTQLDLFDLKRELKRGKFKCPLYYPPTDQAITVQEIKQLEPIPGAWIYLRIAYPNDDDFSKQRSRYPDHTMHEYIIPQIHLRNDLGARTAVQRAPPVMPKNPNQSYLPNMSYNQQNNTQQMQDITMQSQPFYEQPPDDGLRRGLSVTVLNVANYQATSNTKVNAALLQYNKPVYDDQNNICSFTTSVHNPYSEERMEDLPLNTVIPLQKQIQKGDMMNNKQFGEVIKWHEQYEFLKNIPQLFWSNDRKDLYVGIQVLEKEKPKNLQELNDNNTYEGVYNTTGWNFIKVNRPDGSIKSGIYTIDLYKGTPQRTPINEENLQKTGKTITVLIQELIYDDTRFRKTPTKAKDKPRPTAEQAPKVFDEIDNAAFISNLKPQFKTKTFQKRMGIDFYIDALRYLPDKVTVSKIFMEVYNINYEVIFEAQTCLPDTNSFSFNPTYNFRRELRKDHIDPTSIALMTIVTHDKATNANRIVGFAAIPLFVTTGKEPQFPKDQNLSDVFLFSGSYQLPLISQQVKRTVPFTIEKLYELEKLPCASILVRIYAAPMDEQGLRALSIADFTDQKVWLQKGLFHPRPIYGKKVYNTSLYKATDAEIDLFPFRAQRFEDSVRESAYLIAKGLNINKRFSEVELINFLDEQIVLTDDNYMMDMMYFAKYSQKAGVKFIIDGLHQVPNENQLYVAFFSINPPFGGFYPYLPNGNESDEDDPEDADNPEFRVYLQKKQDLQNQLQMQENVQNTERSNQGYNLLSPDTSEVNLSSVYVWESAAGSPQFNNNWATFNKEFNRYQVVVVDIKSISFKSVDPKFEDVGWTIVPLFSYDGYVNSGIFQIPLIKGPVNPQFLYYLRKKNKRKYQNDNRRDRRQPWELLMDKMQEKRSGLRMLEFTSIICRVLDSQRQGHFNVKFDTDRMNYQYLPQEKKTKYSYNEAVALKLKDKKKLSANIPNKENPANFNKKITDACIQGFNLIKYL
ncbi:hypothetical protein ABPG74_021507 [Tetrahymena malaccensis]